MIISIKKDKIESNIKYLEELSNTVEKSVNDLKNIFISINEKKEEKEQKENKSFKARLGYQYRIPGSFKVKGISAKLEDGILQVDIEKDIEKYDKEIVIE